MAEAFPTSIGNKLVRASSFNHENYAPLDVMDDGEHHTRITGDSVWVTLRCSFKNLSSTDFGTLRTFLITNRAEDITWTIDGIDYEGRFSGGWRHHREGNTYNASFTYRAKEV